MTKTKENIKELISDGNLQEAISQLDELIGEGCKDDELYYLRGNAYRKLCNWQLALNNYQPESRKSCRRSTPHADGDFRVL